MSKTRDIIDAETEAAETNRWKCKTCDAPTSGENSDYCTACSQYWIDVENGVFDDDPYGDEWPADECDHEEYEVDILLGRAQCCRCPHSWYQSEDEVRREIERIAAYDEYVAELESKGET
jgi:hypothetical protein